MTVEFTEEQHVDFVAFASPKEGGWDAFFVQHRPTPDDIRRVDYRFRYDGVDGDDIRNWYSFLVVDDNRERARAIISTIFSLRLGSAEAKVEFIECDCNGTEAVKMLLDKQWFHVVDVPEEGEA